MISNVIEIDNSIIVAGEIEKVNDLGRLTDKNDPENSTTREISPVLTPTPLRRS